MSVRGYEKCVHNIQLTNTLVPTRSKCTAVDTRVGGRKHENHPKTKNTCNYNGKYCPKQRIGRKGKMVLILPDNVFNIKCTSLIADVKAY